eukprot:scaffold23479_cov70-Phaeocystis_antarctica.AAC.1
MRGMLTLRQLPSCPTPLPCAMSSQWLDLGEVVAAADHVDAYKGAALLHGFKELQQPHRIAQHGLGLQQHNAPRRRLHLATPSVDVVAADDHLALQLVRQLTLQQPCRPTALMLRADDQQSTPSVAGRLPLSAKASQKPRAEASALLALLVSQLPSL